MKGGVKMNMNDRVREIRSTLGLTQKEFGKKLAIAQSYLTNIETGKREVTEKIQKLICLQFNVNEQWLKTGNGEMFVEDDNTLLAQLSKQYNLDDFSRRFVETFIKLPDAQRKAVTDFAYAVFASETKDVEITPEPSFSHNNRHELTDEEIDAECEDYRRQLEAEAFPADTDSSQKKA
jgi:transcriptional regulator with XRE-family HTH domain